MSGPDPQVVRWYTAARKFPQLIGRTPDGARIWGGPYTFTQAVGGGLVLVVGVNTTSWWARYGLVGNGLLLLAAAYGTVLVLGRIPVGSRSPIAVVAGAARAAAAPAGGRLAGRPVRLRRPHRLTQRLTVQATPPGPPPPARPPAAARLSPAQPTPTPAAMAPPPLTAVQSLLARAAPSTTGD